MEKYVFIILKLLSLCNDLCKYGKCCFHPCQALSTFSSARHYLRQIWKYKEISGSPHAAFQWLILTSDFPCHGLSTNWNEYSSWHSVDMSHVFEHGTSGYVSILDEYGSVSCDFSFAIRLISHSVSNSHTLLPKRSIYEKLKVTFGTPV